MITDQARAIAERSMREIERQVAIDLGLTAGQPANGPESTGPELGRRVATRIMSIEQTGRQSSHSLPSEVVETAAARLAGLEWRAVVAEVGWARMRSRRLYRVVNVLAAMVRRPWKAPGMLGDLGAALARRSEPVLPEPPSPVTYLAELTPLASPVKPRPFPYPHLRIAHAGRLVMFETVAPHFELSSIDLTQELATGFDMLLIEPGVDDPVMSLEPGTLPRFAEAGIPTLFLARTSDHLDHPIVARVDLVVTEDPDLVQEATSRGLTVLHLLPSVDDTIHNPIGWKHHPDPTLLVIADHPSIDFDLETLAPLLDRISLHGPAIPGLNITDHHPQRPIGAEQAATAKTHVAAYTSSRLSATPTSHHQLVLELVAAGTPVITHPDPTLTTLLGEHYLPAATTTELSDHLQTLSHPPTRERRSVPARRHVLTHHTRKHRFEEILTHLNIPTNPTPRISILLATKRPENIEHALNNVTLQTWDHKELLLILHGAENFNLEQINHLTSQLPYPTQILPCPTTWTLGDCLNTGLDHATGTYITKMDDDDHYGPHHLTDLHTAHTYSNADITGMLSSSAYLTEFDLTINRHVMDIERYCQHVSGATITMLQEKAQEHKFLRRNGRVDSTLFPRLLDRGGSMFVTHATGFTITRNEDGHTWRPEGYRSFVERAEEVISGLAPSPSDSEE